MLVKVDGRLVWSGSVRMRWSRVRTLRFRSVEEGVEQVGAAWR